VISAGLTGTPASWLKPSLRANGIDPDQLPATPPKRSYDSNDVDKVKRWRDVWAAGQGVGAVKGVAPIADIVAGLRQEYLAAAERFRRFQLPTPQPADRIQGVAA
jgi:nitronate monooxygenase